MDSRGAFAFKCLRSDISKKLNVGEEDFFLPGDIPANKLHCGPGGETSRMPMRNAIARVGGFRSHERIPASLFIGPMAPR